MGQAWGRSIGNENARHPGRTSLKPRQIYDRAGANFEKNLQCNASRPHEYRRSDRQPQIKAMDKPIERIYHRTVIPSFPPALSYSRDHPIG
jgi:hypothetical protein